MTTTTENKSLKMWACRLPFETRAKLRELAIRRNRTMTRVVIDLVKAAK